MLNAYYMVERKSKEDPATIYIFFFVQSIYKRTKGLQYMLSAEEIGHWNKA